MNIEIIDNHIKLLADFHRYALPSGPPPIGLLHEHRYAELHIVSHGDIMITTNNDNHTIKSGSAVIIPPGMFHCISTANPETKWIAFLISKPCKKLMKKKFSKQFISDFFEKVDSNLDGRHSQSIINHVLFICNELMGSKVFCDIPDKDYSVELENFITNNYNRNIHVYDLAGALNVSETHAQRIVKKCTGKTFGEYLLYQRMLVADNLANHSDMSLYEIATAVGYSSYTGFWKAYKKYKDTQKEEM